MKIAICSSSIPLIYGGAENLSRWLALALEEAGHQVELVTLPMIDRPETLYQQMEAYRWLDLSMADRVICIRPPSYMIPHPHKIVWFIHHIRLFYDLWESSYRWFPDDSKHRAIRAALIKADTTALQEAQALFTISQVVSDRLARYNKLQSEALYTPVYRPERFHNSGMNNEIVCISRLEPAKRQHVLIEALQYTRTPVILHLCGAPGNAPHGKKVREQVEHSSVRDRIIFEDHVVSEEHKIKTLSECLAVAYIPFDEDGCGYVTLEASHSSKAVLTTSDSGGVLELVSDGVNGVVADPDPRAIAEAMDRLYIDREATRRMGENAQVCLDSKQISWAHVLERLLA